MGTVPNFPVPSFPPSRGAAKNGDSPRFSLANRRAGLSAALAVAGLCFLPAAAALAQAAPDAFYLALMRDGKSEMLRGDAAAAKKSFRLASFGFLEHPVLLAEGLVRLALAESTLNDQEAFVATFARLTEVEERFPSYGAAVLSADERRAFEERALEWVTPEVLRSLPSFAPILARKSEIDFARLAPRERARELEKRIAAEPANPRWKVLLAQDEASEERWAKVLARLEGVPEGAEGGAAGCLRGQAQAGLERCAEAIVTLGACPTTGSNALLAEAQITCLVAVEQPEAARAFAARISRPASEAPAVRKAIARIPQSTVPTVPTLPVAAKPTPETRTEGAQAKRPVKEEKRPAKEKPAATPVGKEPTSGSATPAVPKTDPAKAPAPAAAAPAERAPKAPSATSPAKPVAPAESPSAPPAAGSKLTADEEQSVAEARRMLKTVENRDELRRGVGLVQPVADRLPQRSDLQLLTAEIAYRAGLWATGADYFRRATPGGKGPTDPTLRFYYAVCLYESGDFASAAAVIATGLEKLQRPPFVEAYLQKIRAAAP